MSHTPTQTATHAAAEKIDTREALRTPVEIAIEVVTVLAAMTYDERVRAYRSGAISVHELHVAAAWFPERMPLLNDELEWIAIDLE